jgi:hypothetical protein
MMKCGGKACDIEVDILDTTSCAVLDVLTARGHEISLTQTRLVQRQLEAHYIARALCAKCNELDDWEQLCADPFGSALLKKQQFVKEAPLDLAGVINASSDYQKCV